MLIGQAVENYWKLKAIDSIETSLPIHEQSAEERKRIIGTPIASNNIKNILLNYNIHSDLSTKIIDNPGIITPTTH